MIRVGRVTAVYWPGHEAAAAAFAEVADRAGNWPGIPDPPQPSIRLIFVPNDHVFDSITGGGVPKWRAGVAFPNTNTVVLAVNRDIQRVLRHELAHLALRSVIRRGPLWLEEGYASRAAGEWDRLDALRINMALVRGVIPRLGDVNRDLRGGSGRAEQGYALATSAVLLLERLGGPRGLEPIIEALAESPDMDRALRQAYSMTLDQFEQRWRTDLRRRYGWIRFLTSLTAFWTVVAGLVLWVWYRRRKRDRIRREALDDGWIVDSDAGPSS